MFNAFEKQCDGDNRVLCSWLKRSYGLSVFVISSKLTFLGVRVLFHTDTAVYRKNKVI